MLSLPMPQKQIQPIDPAPPQRLITPAQIEQNLPRISPSSPIKSLIRLAHNKQEPPTSLTKHLNPQNPNILILLKLIL